jgi:hypothetical protein
MDSKKYNRITVSILEKEILIKFRVMYIANISKELVEKNLISREYLNNAIRLNNVKNKKETVYPITDEQRIEYLNSILQRECRNATSKLIAEL